MIPLNSATIEGFSERFLISHYDERAPTPEVHRHWWEAVTSKHKRVAIAAPRKHAKSTALNHCYGLASALFQVHPFQIKVCETEKRAIEKLELTKNEIEQNEPLRRFFGIKDHLCWRENEIIVGMKNGYQFRMLAVGMGQSLRGSTFGTIRPTLIQCDDLENEDEVLNPEYRNKAMRWLNKTLLPMLADRGQIRVYGTILHNDSVLNRLLKMKSWISFRYEACDEAISPESILWKEKFTKPILEDIRQVFVDDPEGNGLEGFNMEYRNIAVNFETSYFRPSDFHQMNEDDHKRSKTYYVGGDLAFSQKEGRDYTVLTVGGLDSDGILHIVDERRGRWDGNQVIDELYSIEEAWHPEEYFIEAGAIKATLGAALELRMRKEGYLNLAPNLIPTRDKAIRAVPLQARMRSRGIKWDTDASWFPDHRMELLEFTQAGTRGRHDDRVDADAWLAQGIKNMSAPMSEEEDELEQYLQARRQRVDVNDMDSITGYEILRALQ